MISEIIYEIKPKAVTRIEVAGPGTPGAPGSKWLSGNVNPVDTDGKVGDWYHNNVSKEYFEKTAIDTWTLRGTFGSTTVGWDDVQNIPASFPPSSHTHPIGDITGIVLTEGPQGAFGGDSVDWRFKNDHSFSDPGPNNLKFFTGQFNTNGSIQINKSSRWGIDVTNWIESISNGDRLRIFKIDEAFLHWVTYNVASVVDQGGWYQIVVTYITASVPTGIFTNDDHVVMSLSKKGAIGPDGPAAVSPPYISGTIDEPDGENPSTVTVVENSTGNDYTPTSVVKHGDGIYEIRFATALPNKSQARVWLTPWDDNKGADIIGSNRVFGGFCDKGSLFIFCGDGGSPNSIWPRNTPFKIEFPIGWTP